MEKLTKLIFILAITFGLIACGEKTSKDETVDQSDKPTVAQLHAYKVFHHARYMVTTAADAGGTNKLLHTKKLPTEGTDPVVTPALDHLYTKAVIDLTSGPVIVVFPEVTDNDLGSDRQQMNGSVEQIGEDIEDLAKEGINHVNLVFDFSSHANDLQKRLQYAKQIKDTLTPSVFAR